MSRWFALTSSLIVLGLVLAVIDWHGDAQPTTWRAGVSKAIITPQHEMWLSGYASRDRPSDGKLSDLWVKVVALEDPTGHRLVFVTMDLIGIDRTLSNDIRNALETRHKLSRADVVLSTSHTHSGPIVGTNLAPMYALTEPQLRAVDDYAQQLKRTVIRLVGEALGKREPVRLEFGAGTAGFAVNRRNNPAEQVPALRASGTLEGPFDHTVPVLVVQRARSRDTAPGSPLAIVFGYACHATVLDSYQWSADYPGYAQVFLEEAFPGTTALFWAGCGADQNPLPRRQVALAEQYGRELAEAVREVIAGPMSSLQGKARTHYREIPLALAEVPDRERLEALVQSEDPWVSRTAKRWLEEPGGVAFLNAGYPYPIQCWQFGAELTWITLGGEVVVDYALDIKQDLRASASQRGLKAPEIWVAAYCNDVMAYIPSVRVLAEGGYEGGDSMKYYGLPGPWAPTVPPAIMEAILDTAEPGEN